jgi:hypothetical protein
MSVTNQREPEPPWLLLVFSLAKNGASLRVTVWRKLQRYGALPLGNSGYFLPNTEGNPGYCLLATALMVSPEPKVLLRMKYPLPSSTITDTCVLLMGGPRCPSLCSLGLRIASRECGRLDVVSGDSYEKLSGEIALSVEGEAADRSEIPRWGRSRGMQTEAAVQCSV